MQLYLFMSEPKQQKEQQDKQDKNQEQQSSQSPKIENQESSQKYQQQAGQSQQQLQPQQSQKDAYKGLSDNIKILTDNLQRRLIKRKQKKIQKKEQINDLLDSLEESSNVVVSKLEDLGRKPTITVSVAKVLPQIPESFPKNYNVQITYEDVVMTGNQKFVDFDENSIDDKLILPLLSSETAKLEIWTVQQEPTLYDKTIIDLEKDIESLLKNNTHQNQISLQTNPQTSILYSIQIQGVGFSAWIKNIKTVRQAQQQRNRVIAQDQQKSQKYKMRIQKKKIRFQEQFKSEEYRQTRSYNIKQIDDILNNIDSD